MSEMSREALLEVVRRVYDEMDPVPDDLTPRMQAAAAMADSDLDLELMLLVERTTELARGGTSYTLRFVHGQTDLLLRVAVEGEQSRVDGWIVPPEPMTVRAIPGTTPRSHDALVSDSGRFVLTDLPVGQIQIRLEPHDLEHPAFATPTFEI